MFLSFCCRVRVSPGRWTDVRCGRAPWIWTRTTAGSQLEPTPSSSLSLITLLWWPSKLWNNVWPLQATKMQRAEGILLKEDALRTWSLLFWLNVLLFIDFNECVRLNVNACMKWTFLINLSEAPHEASLNLNPLYELLYRITETICQPFGFFFKCYCLCWKTNKNRFFFYESFWSYRKMLNKFCGLTNMRFIFPFFLQTHLTSVRPYVVKLIEPLVSILSGCNANHRSTFPLFNVLTQRRCCHL